MKVNGGRTRPPSGSEGALVVLFVFEIVHVLEFLVSSSAMPRTSSPAPPRTRSSLGRSYAVPRARRTLRPCDCDRWPWLSFFR